MRSLVFALPLILCATAVHAQAKLTASEIVQKNFFASKVKRIEKKVTMTLITADGGQRERKIVAVSELQPNGVDSNTVIHFLAPSDIRGTGFLQIEHLDGDDDQWIYLPALHKSRRLVSNNKKDSFMGSDFSYGDILPPKVTNYHHTLLREEALDEQPCYVVESVPISDEIRRDSGYSRKVTWIREDNFHEVKVEYYDLGGRRLKTQTLKDIVLVDRQPQRWMATYREMTNEQTGHRTIVKADSYSTAVMVSENTFAVRSLERE